MSEMLRLPTYKRRFHLWKLAHIQSPRIHSVSNLRFPRQSIYHYLDFDALTTGPSIRDPLIASVPGMKYIEHITELPEGYKPLPIKKLGGSPISFITEYRRQNRMMRPLQRIRRLDGDVRTLIIFNYAIINNVWTYPRSGKAAWNMYNLMMTTVMANVNKVASESSRQQYFIVDLPSEMPGLTTLRELTNNQTTSQLAKLPTFEHLFLFEMFRYLGRAHKDSFFTQLTPDATSKTNIIFKYLDKWIVYNLEWLLSFVRTASSKGMYDPTRMEIIFLDLLGKLHDSGVAISSGEADLVDSDGEAIDLDVEYVEVDEEVARVRGAPLHVTEDDDEEDDDEVFIPEFGYDSTDVVVADAGYTDEELKVLEKELLELEELVRLSKAKQVTYVEDEEDDDSTTDHDEDSSAHATDIPDLDIDILSNLGTLKPGVSAAVAKAEELVAAGAMSANDYKRIVNASLKFDDISDPYGSDLKLKEFSKIEPIDFKLDRKDMVDDPVILDKTMEKSGVDDFRRTHITKVLKKQVLESMIAIQKGPVSVTDYTVDVTKDAMNHYETHTLRVTPTGGVPSVVRQIIPVVKEDGTFIYNGNTCMMRAQRADLPIRKVTDTRVALSSYYGKCFVERSSRRRFNYSAWLVNALVVKCQDPQDPHIKNASLSNVTNFTVDVPNIYARLGTRISYFEIGEMKFNFDYSARRKVLALTTDELRFEAKSKMVAVARDKRKLVLMDSLGVLYVTSFHNEKGWDTDRLGTLEELLDIDVSKAPIDSTEIKLLNKAIPTGFCLGYLMGLENLLKLLKADYRRVLSGSKLNLLPDEYVIAFRNESLVFKRDDPITSLVMGGWNRYRKLIADKNINTFENKDVYAVILEKMGIGNRYVRQLDSMSSYFIDPITEKLLVAMKEPTSFTGLLVRATEMLLNSFVPRTLDEVTGSGGRKREIDISGLDRIRGYERFAGFAYEAMTKAMNRYSSSISSGKAKITLNPFETITTIMEDPTTSNVDNINPIQYLREREVVTTSGRGGRNKRSMVASTRVYQDEDMGIISEASVDSGDVGIIVYMPQDAKISSIFGTYSKYDQKKDGMASLISTSSLISPHADGDDPRRRAFISVQHGHGIQGNGYETQPVRTGGERSIVSRMGPEFAQTADEVGKVLSVVDDVVTIEYKSGTKYYQIGKSYTSSEGTTYDSTLVSTVEEGDKVAPGDVITYNQGFFTPSPFQKRRVDYMLGCMVRMALREATYTLEDSCSISSRLAGRFKTTTVEKVPVKIDFNQEIKDLVKIGSKVEINTILCTLEDAISSNIDFFDDATQETLLSLSALSPEAGVAGTISNIEVFYNGDKEYMSDTLRKVITNVERNSKKRSSAMNEDFIPNRIGSNVRIQGETLLNEQALVMVYIVRDVPCGVGDKLVFGNQGKTTVGEVLVGETTTMDGRTVDAIFGAKSFIDRILTSPFKNGLLNSYLSLVGQAAYEMYTEKK